MNSDGVRDAALRDILQAERSMRAIAEEHVRALGRVLTELAYRLDGHRMEAIRREDPRAPEGWTPEQWRAFFARVLEPPEAAWITPEQAERLAAENARLREELRAARREIERLRREVERLSREAPPAEAEAESGEPAPRPARAEIVSGEGWPERWPKPPARFARLLPGDEKRWQRMAMVLCLVARGDCLRLQVTQALGSRFGVKPGSGSLKRLIQTMVEKGLLKDEVLALRSDGLDTRLSVLTLTDTGRDLCRALGWHVHESELERLYRLHEGERQQAHTCAVLAFAYQARRRGWRAEVLPPVPGDTAAAPDVLVEKDGERIYVEVELGADKHRKWQNLADLQGFVALCAPTAKHRMALSAECRLAKLPGRATDLETLIRDREGQGDLWVEAW